MPTSDLINLPLELQMALVAGYLSYRVATTGLDRLHKTTDTVFQTLSYGLVALLAYRYTPFTNLAGAVICAILSAMAVSCVWRAVGKRLFRDILKLLKITNENFYPRTWDHILDYHEKDKDKWAYLSVVLKDGLVLESDIQTLPKGLPLGPVDLDGDGNIALYVTTVIHADGDVFEVNALDEYGRANLTYVPYSEIRTVTVSYQTNIRVSDD